MIIEQKDLLNVELDPIPVRAGCFGGPCACMGTCHEIVGMIDRKKYHEFMSTFKTEEQFLQETMVPHKEEKNTINNRSIKTIYISFPSDGGVKYKILARLKLLFNFEKVSLLENILSTYSFDENNKFFDKMCTNWKELEALLKEYNVKYDLFYSK